VADEQLQQIQAQQQQKQQQRADFDTFLSHQPRMPANDADREELFRKFIQWQTQAQARERH